MEDGRNAAKKSVTKVRLMISMTGTWGADETSATRLHRVEVQSPTHVWKAVLACTGVASLIPENTEKIDSYRNGFAKCRSTL